MTQKYTKSTLAEATQQEIESIRTSQFFFSYTMLHTPKQFSYGGVGNLIISLHTRNAHRICSLCAPGSGCSAAMSSGVNMLNGLPIM